MGRKRGGLAGVWDRNKQYIKPAATFAAGMIPGVGVPLAAGLGALMGGLDRPGKSGIGLDVKGAALGGLSGYGMGKLGQGARGGIQTLLKGQGRKSASYLTENNAAAEAASAAAPPPMGPMSPMSPMMDPSMVIPSSPPMSMNAGSIADAGQQTKALMGAGTPAPPHQSTIHKLLGGVTGKNAPIGAGIAKGALGAIESQQQGRIANQSLDFQQQQFEYRKQQDELERQRRMRIAQLFAPLWNQHMGGLHQPLPTVHTTANGPPSADTALWRPEVRYP